MELEARQELEKLVTNLENFINSPVHTIFVTDTKSTLETVKEGIIELDYCLPTAALQAAHLSGQAVVLTANLTLFEDTVKNLKDRIQDSLNKEQEISHNQIEEEYNDPI